MVLHQVQLDAWALLNILHGATSQAETGSSTINTLEEVRFYVPKMSSQSLPITAKLFINGEFVNSSDGQSFELCSPYSGEIVGRSTQ